MAPDHPEPLGQLFVPEASVDAFRALLRPPVKSLSALQALVPDRPSALPVMPLSRSQFAATMLNPSLGAFPAQGTRPLRHFSKAVASVPWPISFVTASRQQSEGEAPMEDGQGEGGAAQAELDSGVMPRLEPMEAGDPPIRPRPRVWKAAGDDSARGAETATLLQPDSAAPMAEVLWGHESQGPEAETAGERVPDCELGKVEEPSWIGSGAIEASLWLQGSSALPQDNDSVHPGGVSLLPQGPELFDEPDFLIDVEAVRAALGGQNAL